MYIPGSRTIRRLIRVGTAPIARALEVSGCFSAAASVRQGLIRGYLELQGRSTARTEVDRRALDWASLSVELSQPSGYFFSQNLVSNESEFLSAAPALLRLPPGLASIGVGPETMLSYLGLVESPLAFIVDIRRDNARLHYLYRGIFAEATTRTEWLSLLLGRSYGPSRDPGSSAPIDDVLSVVSSLSADEASFVAAHQRVVAALERLPPHSLPFDRQRLRQLHRRFWRLGLDITFQTDGLRLRRYPSLASLLLATSEGGSQRGFLASEASFRRVRRLENASGVVPVVGDVAGGIVSRIGHEIARRGYEVGVVYISNVEQYLFEAKRWSSWVEQLRRLPLHPEAVVIRSYFEDSFGPVPDPPRSLVGQLHRTAKVVAQVARSTGPLPLHQMRTVVHHLGWFLERERQRGYTSYRELVCDPTVRSCD